MFFDHHLFLNPNNFIGNFQIFFIYFIMIRSYFSLDDHLSEAENCFNSHFLFIIRHRIKGKQNTGFFRLDHFLDRYGNADFKVIIFVGRAVKDCSGGKE